MVLAPKTSPPYGSALGSLTAIGLAAPTVIAFMTRQPVSAGAWQYRPRALTAERYFFRTDGTVMSDQPQRVTESSYALGRRALPRASTSLAPVTPDTAALPRT